MIDKSFLYGVIGFITDVVSPDKAIIQFEFQGSTNKAFLKGEKFYHNGKHIPPNQNLSRYVKCGSKVKFSCHMFDNPDPGQCGWFVIMCWCHDDSERNMITLSTGMVNISGTVTNLKQRQGTLSMRDSMGNEHRVHFIASKFYNYGKRLSKPLPTELRLDDKVYFDAIPCFPEENNYNCKWFATIVFKGKKPELDRYRDLFKKVIEDVTEEDQFEKKQTSLLKMEDKSLKEDKRNQSTDVDNRLNKSEKVEESSEPQGQSVRNEFTPADNSADKKSEPHDERNTAEPIDKNLSVEDSKNEPITDTAVAGGKDLSGNDKIDHLKKQVTQKKQLRGKLTPEVLRDLKLLTRDPRSVFVMGEGVILNVINEEYGLILGEFKRNVLQTILFHRSNTFLFKLSLRNSRLSEIFIEGDRVRFLAVGAPSEFVTDWIATQVSVVYPEQAQENYDDDA